MKKSRKKTIYTTVLRYIFRATLASSIYLALRTACAYDPLTMSFWLTGLKVLTLGAFILISVRCLTTIDEKLSRRIDRMKTRNVAREIVFQTCKHCSYRDNPNKCEYLNGDCVKGVEQWMNERI